MKTQFEIKGSNLLKLEKIVKEKKLYKAFFTGKAAILVDDQDILDYSLYKQSQIDCRDYEKMKAKKSYYYCLQDAFKIAEYKTYTIKQVRDKLLLKKHEKHHIELAIKYLKQRRILDDDLFVESYTNTKVRAGYGPEYIRHKLYEKGINQTVDIDKMVLEEYLLHHFNAMYQMQDTFSYARLKFIKKMLYKGYEIDMIERVFDEQNLVYSNKKLKDEYHRITEKLKKM